MGGVPAAKTAIVGVGYTPYSSRSGMTTLKLATVASSAALADSGLSAADIDGVVTFGLNDTCRTTAVATELGLTTPRWTADLTGGGNLACAAVAEASAAIKAGLATSVLVFRAANGRSGRRLGGVGQPIATEGSPQFLVPVGLTSYAQQMAMWCRRYVEVFRPKAEAYANVALRSRHNAIHNERAQQRSPLDFDTYIDSPLIVDPFRLFDICLESDGACALIVTSTDRAADLDVQPVLIAAAEHGGDHHPGTDLEDFISYGDLTRNFSGFIRDRLFRQAEVSVADLDFAEIYDCFTHTVLLTLEGIGIAPYGEAPDYVMEHDTLLLGGRLPVNTHGGLLSEAYIMGMNHIVEAVLQLRGACGVRQVANAKLGLVTAGAMMQGSALILATP